MEGSILNKTLGNGYLSNEGTMCIKVNRDKIQCEGSTNQQ